MSLQSKLSPEGKIDPFHRDVRELKTIVEKIEEVINDGWTI